MKKSVLTFILIVFSFSCFGDAVPYSSSKEIRILHNGISIIHFHNWGNGTSYIDISGEKIDSPPLSYLSVVNDRYIVGLSNIKFRNTIHLVLYDLKGNILKEESMLCGNNNTPHCSESITNTIHWYYDSNPELTITENEYGPLSIKFRVPDRLRCSCHLIPECNKILIASKGEIYVNNLACGKAKYHTKKL
jgi:hypothetical protein